MTSKLEELLGPSGDLSPERRACLKQDLVGTIARGQRRMRILGAGVGALAVAAAAGTTLAVVFSAAPPASAAWSAVPNPLTISASDPMIQQCIAGLPPAPSPQTGASALTPLVAESRGTSQAALLQGDGSQAICIATPSSRAGGVTTSPALAAGSNISLAGNGGQTGSASGERYVYGRVSSRVASVAVTTTSGTRVTASVANGAYVAWWPGGDAPDTIEAQDGGGQAIATLRPTSQ